MNGEVSSERYKVKLLDVQRFVQEQGMLVMSRTDELDEEDLHDLQRSVGKLICGPVGRLDRLITTHDLKDRDLPATTPEELVSVKRSDFVQFTKEHIPRLQSADWTEEMIEQIDEQHASLL